MEDRMASSSPFGCLGARIKTRFLSFESTAQPRFQNLNTGFLLAEAAIFSFQQKLGAQRHKQPNSGRLLVDFLAILHSAMAYS
jgi:hypothetical protein